MKFLYLVVSALCLAPAGMAQLTQDQKITDFMQLAGLYAKNYAPYEWKRDVMGFDLYNVKPWLDRVKASKDDLEFFDICVNYVASLQDSHDEYTLPSDFRADLHFYADIYEGKVLIDFIDRSYLPKEMYPFVSGDELVSIDERSVDDLVKAYVPYAANGSGSKSTRLRLAADALTFRIQAIFPRAHQIGDSATIVVRRQNGDLETYTISWDKRGTPYTQAGRVPGLQTSASKPENSLAAAMRSRRSPHAEIDRNAASRGPDNPWGVWTGDPAQPVYQEVPDYMKPLIELQEMSALNPKLGAAGFGRFNPAFNPPAGFQARLGGARTDQFLSGTFPIGSSTVGFIRVSTMSPSNQPLALQQFLAEITYFQQNTDALVIDVMRNGGGNLCYSESLEKLLIPYRFHSVAYNIRATQFWVQVFSSSIEAAKAAKSDEWVVDLYTAYLKQVQQALSENRGMTGPLPICSTAIDVVPTFDSQGNDLAYTKPILVLTDDFTLSAAESFAMYLQDADRATIFGTRTDGGGGNPAFYPAGTYSEGNTRVTRSFIVRGRMVQTPEFPPSQWLENTGVYPDIYEDYMTKDNLTTGGKPFVAAMTSAVSDLIKKSK